MMRRGEKCKLLIRVFILCLVFCVVVSFWVRMRNWEGKDRRRDFDQTEKDNRMTNSVVGRLAFHLGLVIVIKWGEWCLMCVGWEWKKKQKEILERMVSSNSDFHWKREKERRRETREKDAKSPVANLTIRNLVTSLVKSPDFWQLHKYLQTITQQKRRKKKEEKKSGWITIDDGQSRMDNGDELCSS